MRLLLSAVMLSAAAVAVPGVAQAPNDVAGARRAGMVGERYDGYLGLAANTSEAVRRQVGAINIRRRSLYTQLATRRRVTLQVASIAAGCELLARVAVGEVYMLSDGAWRRRNPGEAVALPEHCPR